MRVVKYLEDEEAGVHSQNDEKIQERPFWERNDEEDGEEKLSRRRE